MLVETDAEPASVLVLNLSAENIPAAEARLLTGRVAAAVAALPGLRTSTREDLMRLMQLQAEQSLMECSTSMCVTELADAMGAEYVVTGRVGRLGDDFVTVQLALFNQEGETLKRVQLDAKDTGEAAKKVDESVRKLFGDVVTGLDTPPQSSVSPLVWVGGGTLATGLLVATAAGGVALTYNYLLKQPGTEVRPEAKAQLQQTVWIPLVGLGAGLLTAAAGGALLGYGVME